MIFYVLKYIISYCYFEHKSNNTVIIILDHWWISVSFCSQTAFHQWCIQPILSYELYVTWLPQNKRNLSFSVANRNRLTSLVVCSPINDPKMNTGHLLEGIAGGNIFFIEHGTKRNDIISLFPLNSLSWVKYKNFLWTYSWSLRGLMIISYVECTDAMWACFLIYISAWCRNRCATNRTGATTLQQIYYWRFDHHGYTHFKDLHINGTCW